MVTLSAQILRISPAKDPDYGYKVHTSHGIFRAPPGDMPLPTGVTLSPSVGAELRVESGVIHSFEVAG